MVKIKKVDFVEAITISIGISGAVLFFVGAGSCFLGVSSKVVDKLAQTLKPHELVTQKMVNYGALSSFAGLFLFSGGMLIANTVGERLLDEELARYDQRNQLVAIRQRQLIDLEQEQQNQPDCTSCIYYCGSAYLHCAVNPELPKNCKDYAPFG